MTRNIPVRIREALLGIRTRKGDSMAHCEVCFEECARKRIRSGGRLVCTWCADIRKNPTLSFQFTSEGAIRTMREIAKQEIRKAIESPALPDIKPKAPWEES